MLQTAFSAGKLQPTEYQRKRSRQRNHSPIRSSQQKAGELSEQERITRDTLIRKINSLRISIQHAANAIWPYTDQTGRPTRKAFKLPLNRPLNP